jgi:signal transduction histidine kinase
MSRGAFYLRERADTLRSHRSPDRQEDRKDLLILLRMGGATRPCAVRDRGLGSRGALPCPRVLAPMREAAERARRARLGSVDLTLPLRGTRYEWDELADVMNGRLREQHASIAREKAFGANAAHELRTPSRPCWARSR